MTGMTQEDEYCKFVEEYVRKKNKTVAELTEEEWNEVFHLFYII